MMIQESTWWPGVKAMVLAGAVLLIPRAHSPAAEVNPLLRPPAVPLVAHDPYFSIWSPADRLTDTETMHWTGARQPLHSLVRIDGRTFRLMGTVPTPMPALPQKQLEVLPTRTLYTFQNEQVELVLTFLTPALPEDLEVLSRPVTYLIWQLRSLDGQNHQASIYFDASAELAVNTPDQRVVWSREDIGGRPALRLGTLEQPVLRKKGDNLRIDWGYAYVMPDRSRGITLATGPGAEMRAAFAAGQDLPTADDTRQPRPTTDQTPAMACVFTIKQVGATATSRRLMLAYDDQFSIKYMGQSLRPYWRRQGAEMADLLKVASAEFRALEQRCRAFDAEFMADLEKAGGRSYAQIAALAYRQAFAGNKLAADASGHPLLFPKENFSNGCIGTVDVIYPMAPLFLLFGPALSKAMLVPVMDYGSSPRWRFPFAPHDLGTYPLANGQVYGGGERTEENQMPVEESGNLLLVVAALAQMEGHADFAARYWPALSRWAEYLRDKGADPENQLCTDDFAGHLAHNVNLSAKAIVALGAFARVAEQLGKTSEAKAYRQSAERFTAQWIDRGDDGDHFRLAFDKPKTWSQKYNLVWDRVLGLNLFPSEVIRKEMAYYHQVQNRFGLPLDNRKEYTKLDWLLWTATLSGQPQDFTALVDRVYLFLNETPDRVPMTDWYWTHTGKKVGFQARPVVGGVFIPLLAEPALWKKWSARGGKVTGEWAPIPATASVQFSPVIPTAQSEPIVWRYTTTQPGSNWMNPDFDDASWASGSAGFGTRGTPGAVVRTEWRSPDIWLRREFNLPAALPPNLQFLAHHDEDVDLYVNGVLAATESGYTSEYEPFEMTAQGRAALKPGSNVLAVHCRQTDGGQYIDVGLVTAR